jgi:hypothetical protein
MSLTNQKFVCPTMILTVPGNLHVRVNVSSKWMASSSSSVLSSEEEMSSAAHSSRSQGGEPEDLNIPEAAACVSVGELRDAEGWWPREFRAMSMCDGLVVIVTRRRVDRGCFE